MKISPMPKEAVLSGILYRVTVHEGMIIFEEAITISGHHARMCFTRTEEPGRGCWYVEISSTANKVMVSHIRQAYALICSYYGENFEEKMPL